MGHPAMNPGSVEEEKLNISALFYRIFKPFEVRMTCNDIEAFLRADNGLCLDVVRREALILANNTDKVLYSIRIDHMKPDQLALTLIYNVLTKQLQSGWQHIYRGVLSMIGQDMLRLWHLTAKELVKRGYSTEAECNTEAAGLMNDIRSAG
ncbi:MAG: hypothetical protein ACYCPO_00230 [Acidobacteriaceae bacterium]